MGISIHIVFVLIVILIEFNWTGSFNHVHCADSESDFDSNSEYDTEEEIDHGDDINLSKIYVKVNPDPNLIPEAEEIQESNQTLLIENEKLRLRRNILLTTNTLNGQNNAEGLLSSCQLTNLLLYQFINQKLSSAGPGELNSPLTISPFLQPQPQPIFPQILLGGAILGDLNQNSFNAQILSETYLSTSTNFIEMTTTSTHTVTLMFGNKESAVVITDTKAFNVTSTQVFTLTSTIQPTQINDQIDISPTLPPNGNGNNADYDGIRYGKEISNLNFMSTPVLEDLQSESSGKSTKQRRKNRRKENANAETGNSEEPESSSRKYIRQENQFFKKQHLNSEPPVPEDNYYYQKDYNGQSFYIRRSKRRGDESDNYELLSSEREHDTEYENSDFPMEKDYLLEPSSDAQDVESVDNRCPKPKDITITKTVTKFVNSPSAIKFNTGDFNIHDGLNPATNAIRNIPPIPVVENFKNKEHRSFRPKLRSGGFTSGGDPSDLIVNNESSQLQRSQRNFRNYVATTTEANVNTVNTRSSRRFGNSRINFGPEAAKVKTSSNSNNYETSRPSSKFIRTRGTSGTTTTTVSPLSGNSDQYTGRRRSLSRFRSTTIKPTEEIGSSDSPDYFSPRYSSGRFKSRSSYINYDEYESTTTTTRRPTSRFKSKNRFSNRYYEQQLESTSETLIPEYGETTERKYKKSKSRFTVITENPDVYA